MVATAADWREAVSIFPCQRCGKFFTRHPKTPLRKWCSRTCCCKAYRERNWDRLTRRERDRAREQAKLRKKSKDLAEFQRVKAHAYNQVNYAIRTGRMTRGIMCQLCLLECETQAHHHDHHKALDVLWVCIFCHKGLDAQRRFGLSQRRKANAKIAAGSSRTKRSKLELSVSRH